MPAEIKWQPKTQLYKYNYGVGMNFYQPMVDFIEDKAKCRRIAAPHLPWSDELGLDQYDPLQVRSYSEHDLYKIAEKTERSAKLRLSTSRHASSSFLLSESASAARLTTKIHQEGRKRNKIVKEITKMKSRIKDDIDYNPERDRQVERDLKAQQRFLRGKSAKGIESELLSESRKVIAQGLQSQHVSASCSGRIITAHMKIMDERSTAQLEQAFKQPLNTLSEELRGFDRRTTYQLIDQR